MKVCVYVPPNLSQAMHRIAKAFTRYLPDYGVRVARSWEDAHVVLLHTIGEETFRAVEHLHAQGKRVIIAQYCLRTTQRPHLSQWVDLYRQVEGVWSYYDLPALAREDGVDFGGVNFIHTPLGVDADVFRPRMAVKRYTIVTSGYVAETEGVNEAVAATAQMGGKLFHLGPAGVAVGPHVTVGHGIPDGALAARYAESRFVAGLRRGEGFELPAAEGLMCGARPVMFDRPHYRRWFDGFAVFIPERSPEEVTRDLVNVFTEGASLPVTMDEFHRAKHLFSWSSIVGTVWRGVDRGSA